MQYSHQTVQEQWIKNVQAPTLKSWRTYAIHGLLSTSRSLKSTSEHLRFADVILLDPLYTQEHGMTPLQLTKVTQHLQNNVYLHLFVQPQSISYFRAL